MENIILILVSIFIPILSGLAFLAYNNPFGYLHAYKYLASFSMIIAFFIILISQVINSAYIDVIHYIPNNENKVLVATAIDENDQLCTLTTWVGLIFNIAIYLFTHLKTIKDKDGKPHNENKN